MMNLDLICFGFVIESNMMYVIIKLETLVTKAITLVKCKLYFPMVGGSRELSLGANSPCHQGFNPGEIKILFPKGGGVTRSLPWCEESSSPRLQPW